MLLQVVGSRAFAVASHPHDTYHVVRPLVAVRLSLLVDALIASHCAEHESRFVKEHDWLYNVLAALSDMACQS
jgi:hypothetical protein